MRPKRKKRVLGRAFVPPPGGRHKDRKKESAKRAARGKVQIDEYT